MRFLALKFKLHNFKHHKETNRMKPKKLFYCIMIGSGILATSCWHKSSTKNIREHPGTNLARDLTIIEVEDQRYRQELQPLLIAKERDTIQIKAIWKKIHVSDSINLAKIKTILEKHGWPNPKEAGEEGSVTIWAVLQHASLQTREQYLPMVEKAVSEGKLPPKYLAYLTDRIATDNGLKQKYGTQFYVFSDQNKTVLMPLINPDSVEVWRKTLGIRPLAKIYKESTGNEWSIKNYEKDSIDGEKLLAANRIYQQSKK